MTDQHTLTLDQAADALGMPARTVRHMVKKKGLPCVKPGRRLFFSKDEILEWKRKQRPTPKSKPDEHVGTDDVDVKADTPKPDDTKG